MPRRVVERADLGGQQVTVWVEPGRENGLSTSDPCCGIWYDGNQYNDALTTCVATDECADGLHPVHPGLADDPFCGDRRRCVPYPEARVILLPSAGQPASVTAEDGEGSALPTGTDPDRVPYDRVTTTREGSFVIVRGDQTRPVLIAVDHGARYTIRVRGTEIEEVFRDGPTQLEP